MPPSRTRWLERRISLPVPDEAGEMLKIAFLNSWTLETGEGSGTAAGILGLAGGLERLGHEVVIVPPRGGIPGRTFRRLLYNLELAFRPPAGDFDLAVGFDIDGFLLPRVPGRKYAVCLKGVSAEEMRFESGWPRIWLGILSRLEGRNARRADKVFVTSEHSQKVAGEAYGLAPGKMALVPEGIDLRVWDDSRIGPLARREARPTILSVARQYPRKNTQMLIAAIPAVRAEVPGVRLRIVGGGPMLSSLRMQADRLGLGEVVEFMGEVARDEAVRQAYFQADVFCLPSLQEGFGIVFLEAMAAGLPIVAARTAAVPEVAPDGEAALLTPPGDHRALEAALIRLLKDRDMSARLARGGRKRVRRYDWPKVAAAFLREAG